MDTSSVPQKRCTKCGDEFPATIEYFSAYKARKGGLHSHCRRCAKVAHAKWYQAHTEQAMAANAKYRAEHREQVNTKRAQWRADNPERNKAAAAKWRANHPEQEKVKNAKWRTDHPEQEKARRQRRRARKLSLPNTFTSADWQSCLKYFDYRCAVCGRQQGLWHTLAMDHWIPLTDPRPDNPGTVPTNIVPLCHGEGGCNNSKHDNDPIEWAVARFGEKKSNDIISRIRAYFDSLKG